MEVRDLMVRDLIIIGGGPAGLTAGLYGMRAGLKTLLLERGMPGGQAATADQIENYPGFPEGIKGPELAERLDRQARRLGLEIMFGEVTAVEESTKAHEDLGQEKVVKTSEGDFASLAVIIATGTQPRHLGVPGEEELRGKGVSYCATCDGAFFKGKRVIVVGGGDSAISEALFLTKFASEVVVVHRRGELRAARAVQEDALKNPKIKFIWDSVVEEIAGDGKVTGVTLRDVLSGTKTPHPTDGIFVYVGVQPNTALSRGFVSLNDHGYIVTDEKMHTSRPGVFAAGDVREKSLRQIVTAVADGAIAAMEAEKYIAGGQG